MKPPPVDNNTNPACMQCYAYKMQWVVSVIVWSPSLADVLQWKPRENKDFRASCQSIAEQTIRSVCTQQRSQTVRCWWPLILRVPLCLSVWRLTNTATWRCWKDMCPWLYCQDTDRLQVPLDTSIQPVTAFSRRLRCNRWARLTRLLSSAVRGCCHS